MEVDVKTYLSAKWRVEVCSGDSEARCASSYYPFGEEMRPNMILDSWLESFPLFAHTGSHTLMAGMTDGWMQLGKGTGVLDYSQIALSNFVRETNYIRPNTTGGYYYDVTGSGMRTFSRTYEFPTETSGITYYEAGFKPYQSSVWNNATPAGKRNPIFSRFLFPTGSDGLVSGITLGIGQYMKVKYDVSIRVPSLVNAIPVTGTGVVYGDFNGSGQIKLIGKYSDFFGNISPDGLGFYNNNFGAPTGVSYWDSMLGVICPKNLVYSNVYDYYRQASASYIPTGVNFPAGITGEKLPTIYMGGLNDVPGSTYNTVFSTYAFGNKYVDFKVLFKANFPNYDMEFGGILFSRYTIRVGFSIPSQYTLPDSGFGWYYKFDNPQTKYLDQLLEVNYRFSVDRD